MITMMQHPQHGKHPATGHEIGHMKANGWTVCPPKAVSPTPATEVAPEQPAPRRRGPNKPKAE